MKTVTLANGIEILFADRTSNTSGYKYVTFSPAWTLDETKPFIACHLQPTDPTVLNEVTAKLRQSLHLGHYADAREAAYVIGLYNADPVNTVKQFNKFGSFDTFPADLYNLPVNPMPAITSEDKPKLESKKRAKIVEVNYDVPAQNNLIKFFERPIILSVVELFDSVADFQKHLTGFTIQQFATEYGLPFREGASNV